MTDVVILADLWDGDTEAVITTWLAAEGGSVRPGDLLAEIMVEKVQYEIRSPAAGRLTILKDTDAVIIKGDTIARIT